jgi:hypothetical protein
MVRQILVGGLMRSLVILSGLLVTSIVFGSVSFKNSVDFPPNAQDIRLSFAEYRILPVKTEVRPIPGCTTYGDRAPGDCEEVVVLESVPVVQVSIGHSVERRHDDDVYNTSPFSTYPVNFKLDSFTEEEIAQLKRARRIFRSTGGALAKKLFRFETKPAQRTRRVVDEKNSVFCRYYDYDYYTYPIPGCTPKIVFKEVVVKVLEVTVFKK